MEVWVKEDKVFSPPEELRRRSNASWELYRRAEEDRLGFWEEMARRLEWFHPWEKVLEWDPPFARWFGGGRLNACHNCVDRHVKTWRRNKAAIIWEGEPGEERILTYQDLHREVQKAAWVLQSLGVKPGDRVAIYLPMIPELPVTMLACARIGAVHTVIFAGFSAEALRERINDAQAKILVTADGGYRRGQVIPLKRYADEALEGAPSVEKVVVVKRVGDPTLSELRPGRDLYWHELMAGASLGVPCVPREAEDPLFILYTSGSTGKPKGVLHTTGGYLTQVAATTYYVFDLKEEDLYWCTADIGWVTGHSYIVYGPLAEGATVLMYEGAPDWPARDRFWQLIEKYRVTVFYTAPTAIRTFMCWGESYPAAHDLSSLRLLGSVGEPINPEAWLWYYRHIGGERCPIVDTWWQTETGAIMITPLPGLVNLKPGSATLPFPGVKAEVVDSEGRAVAPGEKGYLVLTAPWPAMLRTLYGDPERYREVYWSRFPGIYFTGDGAMKDEEGYFWLLGRVDDVLNVSGHRLSTMELESVLIEHPAVTEAAVIGRSHPVKGQAVVAFVTLKEGEVGGPTLEQELKKYVARRIGPIARPEDVIFTAALPKTRSGKIMRRLLRDIAEGRALGDTTSLADPEVIERLKEIYTEEADEG